MTIKTLSVRCCISGGGPAGIMLGYLLARAGIEVVVLEKWPDFFRDFRGDTIHPSTMEVLHELDLLDDFLKLPHDKTTLVSARIGGTMITVADFSYLNVRTPFIAFTPQWHFLNFLAQKGKAYPHFTLIMETEAYGLIEEEGAVKGVRAKNKQGEFEIRAELVIGADGRNSILRQKANLQVENKGAPVDVLWFRLSKQTGDFKQPFGIIENGKLLVMIDRGDYWQCAFNILKGDFEGIKKKGMENFHQEIIRLVPFTKERISEIVEWEQIKLLSVSVDRLKKWYRSGLICIGDAAHAMSPMGGVGINLAIQDSVAAANILVPAFKKGSPTERDLAKIQKRREFPTRITQRFQVLMQDRILIPYMRSNKPTSAPWILRLFNWFPFLRMLPALFIGIGIRAEHIRYEQNQKTKREKIKIVLYWIFTVLTVFELIYGAMWDFNLLNKDFVKSVFQHLNYPHYFATILGIAKIPAAIVIVIPGFLILKEWAYAGTLYIFLGAFVSHLAVHDEEGFEGLLWPPLIFGIFTFLSWWLRPQSRKVKIR